MGYCAIRLGCPVFIWLSKIFIVSIQLNVDHVKPQWELLVGLAPCLYCGTGSCKKIVFENVFTFQG